MSSMVMDLEPYDAKVHHVTTCAPRLYLACTDLDCQWQHMLIRSCKSL